MVLCPCHLPSIILCGVACEHILVAHRGTLVYTLRCTLRCCNYFAHPRCRVDAGLVTLVRHGIAVRKERDIVFRDLGDRVAMLLQLAVPVEHRRGKAMAELYVVNTHLLFPHQPYFSVIRMRELRKILAFLEMHRRLRFHPSPLIAFLSLHPCHCVLSQRTWLSKTITGRQNGERGENRSEIEGTREGDHTGSEGAR